MDGNEAGISIHIQGLGFMDKFWTIVTETYFEFMVPCEIL